MIYLWHIIKNKRYMEEQARMEDPCCTASTPTTVRKLNRIREINIGQLDSGYVVKVGCQSFAIENKTMLLKYLKGYIENPDEVEKKWMETNKLD